jgi:hypothetical protein
MGASRRKRSLLLVWRIFGVCEIGTMVMSGLLATSGCRSDSVTVRLIGPLDARFEQG